MPARRSIAYVMLVLLLLGHASGSYGAKSTCDGVVREFTIDYYNLWDPLLSPGDVTEDREVRADDALLILRAATGSVVPTPTFDIDGSGDEDGNDAVTAADALLTLRKAIGLSLPATLFDAAKLRCEMMRWIVAHQNALGLVEFSPDRKLAATYDQAVVGLAAMAHYRMRRDHIDRDCSVSTTQALGVAEKILRFYVGRYYAGGFHGFAEFYDPATGNPDYSIGAGGNPVGPNAYVMALAAQVYGISWRSLESSFAEDVVLMATEIGSWFERLIRPDGGVSFGTSPDGTRVLARVSAEHNISARDSLVALSALFDELGDHDGAKHLFCIALSINDFLRTVLWDGNTRRFLAGLGDDGQPDPRAFTDVFALAGMSPLALPAGSPKNAFLASADPILRGKHPADLDPSTVVDGYGSFDASGIQNEWSAQMAFAYNTLDEQTELWKSAYLLRQIAAVSIAAADGSGVGIAQAATAHESGFDGFIWNSSAIAPAAVAWWIFGALDFHPFILQTDDLYVFDMSPASP